HRNHYGNGVPANDPNSCRSWGGDTVILKSTDNLATFNQTLNVDPAPQSSYIFKTSPDGKAKFSNFQFVQFDYNPADPANYGVAPAGYVYILSANQWNNADELYVGRVRATNMANLNVNDWTFYSDGSWVAGQAGIDAATGVFYNKNRASYAMVQYIGAPVFKYVMFNWYHPNLLQCATSWWNVGRITKWEFYEAPGVIGPWTPVVDSTGKDMSYKWEDPQLDSRPPNYYGPIGAGMYMPGAINKFITSGPSSSDVWLFAAGNWQDWGNYSLITVKATFSPKLTNPGFEAGSLHGWNALGAARPSNANAHSGTWSGWVTTGSDSISRVVTGLAPYTTYEVTGWGKTNGTDQVAIGADSFGGTVSPVLISTSTYSQGRIKFEVQ